MSLFSNLRYDLLRDFSPISVAGSFAILLAVPDRSPYKSLQQLVEDARRSPGKLTLGAINPGSTQNLSAHLFQQITGISTTIVPYRTAPDLVTALLRGDVDLGFDYYAALQSVLGPGKVRIIATTAENRDPLLMEVPTAKESGLPSYVVTSWNGIGARAGVPAGYFGGGREYIGKPATFSDERRNEFIANGYHKPGDMIDPRWALLIANTR